MLARTGRRGKLGRAIVTSAWPM